MYYDTYLLTYLLKDLRLKDQGPSFRMRRLWRLWRHEVDVIESLDVVDVVTNRRDVGTFI